MQRNNKIKHAFTKGKGSKVHFCILNKSEKGILLASCFFIYIYIYTEVTKQ